MADEAAAEGEAEAAPVVPTEAPDELLSYCLVGKPVLIAAMEGLDVVINLGSAKVCRLTICHCHADEPHKLT